MIKSVCRYPTPSFNLGKGVIAMGKLFKAIVKRIVESDVAHLIYDWLKHLFDEDDDD